MTKALPATAGTVAPARSVSDTCAAHEIGHFLRAWHSGPEIARKLLVNSSEDKRRRNIAHASHCDAEQLDRTILDLTVERDELSLVHATTRELWIDGELKVRRQDLL